MKNFHEMCLALEEQDKKYTEEFKVWEECFSLDENWLTTPLKFAAGAAGNFIGQTGRALGNAATGFAGEVGAVADMSLGGLQMLGGGRKKGWDRIKKGWRDGELSGLRLGKGVLQAGGALSGVTPILRGAQAASEPMFKIKGLYAPSGSREGSFSDLFGMGPWEDSEEKNHEPRKEQPVQPETKKKPKPAQKQDEKKAAKIQSGPEPNDECKHLIRLYNAVKNPEARKALQRKMAIVDPVWYRHAMEKAKARLQRKP